MDYLRLPEDDQGVQQRSNTLLGTPGSLHEGGVAVSCHRDHLTSGSGETWREWSSLELQVEKAESIAQEDHRRDFLRMLGQCVVSLQPPRQYDAACVHGQNC